MHNPLITKMILDDLKTKTYALTEYTYSGDPMDCILTPIPDTKLFDKVEIVQDSDLEFIIQQLNKASKICLWELSPEDPQDGRENTIKQKRSQITINCYILTLYPSKLLVNQEKSLEREEIMKYNFLDYNNKYLGFHKMDYTAVAHSSVPVDVNNNGEQTAYMTVIQWTITTKRNYGG